VGWKHHALDAPFHLLTLGKSVEPVAAKIASPSKKPAWGWGLDGVGHLRRAPQSDQ
jgi:hypothetical protein